jgi:hypothetical protein
VTRGGKRIAWNAFTGIKRVITQVTRGSSSTVEHYELVSPKGKVVVAIYRLENGQQIFDTIWQHLPEKVKVTRP